MSPDLREIAGAALNAGLTAMSNGCKLTSRRTAEMINTYRGKRPGEKSCKYTRHLNSNAGAANSAGFWRL